jgi:hypothetical protein
VVPSAELSSLANALDDLTRRFAALAEEAQRQQREDEANELFAVERGLRGASRRLGRMLAVRRPR